MHRSDAPHAPIEPALSLGDARHPFWTDLNKFEKFINGRWKRYDYGNISLADFFFGVFEDANVEHIRIAVANLELACVCCFGKEWIACSMTLQAHLASAEWLNRQVPYLRFVLEKFLCDFFWRLPVEYVATTGEPTSLLLNTDVVSLFVVSTQSIIVNFDQESTWGYRFKGMCNLKGGSLSRGKRRLEEAEEEDIVKGEKKLQLPSKICLKAAFTLFNVGQDHLG